MEISLENLYVDIGIKGLRDLLSKTLGYQKNQYDWFQRSPGGLLGSIFAGYVPLTS